MSKITEKVWTLAEPVARENGVELWDVEFVKEAGTQYLRVYIDKPEGIQPVGGQKNYVGELTGYEQGDVTLTVNGKEVLLKKPSVAQVRLYVEI